MSKQVQYNQKCLNRKKEHGLALIQIWAHPDEHQAIRDYGAKKPLTKAINLKLKGD